LPHAICGIILSDVKKLTNFTPEYRMKVGDYRVLFEVEAEDVVIYLIKHRKEAYRSTEAQKAAA